MSKRKHHTRKLNLQLQSSQFQCSLQAFKLQYYTRNSKQPKLGSTASPFGWNIAVFEASCFYRHNGQFQIQHNEYNTRIPCRLVSCKKLAAARNLRFISFWKMFVCLVQRSVSTAIGTLIVLEGIASASMDLWGTVWIAGVRRKRRQTRFLIKNQTTSPGIAQNGRTSLLIHEHRSGKI